MTTMFLRKTASKQGEAAPPPELQSFGVEVKGGEEAAAALIPSNSKPRPPPRPSLSQQAFASTANLANLLPTGTLLAFQVLTPIFSHNGSCDAIKAQLTGLLLLALAASCFLACFTDSFRGPDGKTHYGFATFRGMWLFDSPLEAVPDLTKYRLRPVDFVHAVLSVLVFGAVALRDKNVVSCFYPTPEKEAKEVLDVVPLAVGFVCSLLFVVFPTTRHGIGYPVSLSKGD